MPIEISGLPTALTGKNNESDIERARSNSNDLNKHQSETTGSTKADTIFITETAAQLQAMETKLAEVPAVDLVRVKDIQQLLESGKYEINADKLADNLLRFETQL